MCGWDGDGPLVRLLFCCCHGHSVLQLATVIPEVTVGLCLLSSGYLNILFIFPWYFALMIGLWFLWVLWSSRRPVLFKLIFIHSSSNSNQLKTSPNFFWPWVAFIWAYFLGPLVIALLQFPFLFAPSPPAQAAHPTWAFCVGIWLCLFRFWNLWRYLTPKSHFFH